MAHAGCLSALFRDARLPLRCPPTGELALPLSIGFNEPTEKTTLFAYSFTGSDLHTMLTADALAQQLDGLIHLDTQRVPSGIDLTVDTVYRTTGHGQLDFGGSEFEAAPREALTPVLDDPADDYAWWTLEKGAYIVQYNESLTLDDGQEARVSPLERTLLAGAHHGTVRLEQGRAPLETLLVVSRMGVRLKENCRLSRLTVARHHE